MVKSLGNAILLHGVARIANLQIGVPGDQKQLLAGFPAISNFREVLAQRGDDLLPPAIYDIPAEFLECDVHDVVVMELLGRDFIAQFEPDAVKQIDFFGR